MPPRRDPPAAATPAGTPQSPEITITAAGPVTPPQPPGLAASFQGLLLTVTAAPDPPVTPPQPPGLAAPRRPAASARSATGLSATLGSSLRPLPSPLAAKVGYWEQRGPPPEPPPPVEEGPATVLRFPPPQVGCDEAARTPLPPAPAADALADACRAAGQRNAALRGAVTREWARVADAEAASARRRHALAGELKAQHGGRGAVETALRAAEERCAALLREAGHSLLRGAGREVYVHAARTRAEHARAEGNAALARQRAAEAAAARRALAQLTADAVRAEAEHAVRLAHTDAERRAVDCDNAERALQIAALEKRVLEHRRLMESRAGETGRVWREAKGPLETERELWAEHWELSRQRIEIDEEQAREHAEMAQMLGEPVEGAEEGKSAVDIARQRMQEWKEAQERRMDRKARGQLYLRDRIEKAGERREEERAGLQKGMAKLAQLEQQVQKLEDEKKRDQDLHASEVADFKHAMELALRRPVETVESKAMEELQLQHQARKKARQRILMSKKKLDAKKESKLMGRSAALSGSARLAASFASTAAPRHGRRGSATPSAANTAERSARRGSADARGAG